MNDTVTSYHVVAALKRQGFSAWKPGVPGFKVWSARGGMPHVQQFGFPPLSVQQQWLATYAATLAAAGFTTEMHGHMLDVTGRAVITR